MLRFLIAIVAVSTGCISSAADHESLGDQAYASGEFSNALVEYRLALRQEAPNAVLRAKAGQAAYNSGDLLAAAEEFVAMAIEDAGRVAEATDGLELVARAAVEQGDRSALEAAVAGIEQVANRRAQGEFARELARGLGDEPRTQEALPVLVLAAATAPDAARQDSLMYVYASVLRRLERCEEAVPVYESLVRRQRQPELVRAARDGGARCALRVGAGALDRGVPQQAETWFVRAANVGGDTTYGRQGYVRLGDVRLALGNYEEALAAYERAILGLGVTDSLYRVVSERINAIADAETVFR